MTREDREGGGMVRDRDKRNMHLNGSGPSKQNVQGICRWREALGRTEAPRNCCSGSSPLSPTLENGNTNQQVPSKNVGTTAPFSPSAHISFPSQRQG